MWGRVSITVAVALLVSLLPGASVADEVLAPVIADGFSTPVFLTAPEGDDRLFVVEKSGAIRIIDDGRVRTLPFLNLAGHVSTGSEQGLLGMAFHLDYATNGKFYVSYTDTAGRSRVVEYRRLASDPNQADPSSARNILTVSQPATNHNGGMIAFGPDRYLYVGLGDGGGSNDRFGHAQNPNTLLGAILRINVDSGSPYAIPSDNPFGNEVWAFGLRNPWRFSFDFDGNQLHIGDVGQNAREEIDAAPADAPGLNYGWPIREGNNCFLGPCGATGLTAPLYDYSHGSGCSVTGGYVYRGSELAELAGQYFFADWCGRWVRSLNGATVVDWSDRLGLFGNVTSFGTDGHRELYVVNGGGEVIRFSAGVDRSAGADRYATAAAAALDAFTGPVPVAYVGTGEAFPDALVAGPVARSEGGPVLLVRRDDIPTATAEALAALDPDRLVVLGGTGAVSSSVEAALQSIAPTERVAGVDRYATAAALATARYSSPVPVAYLATGENYPDALVSGPVAAATGGPILLTARERLPAATRAELIRLSPARIVILGGEGAIAATVAAELAPVATVERLAGVDRYATAAAVSASHFETGTDTVYLATGDDFPDALVAGALDGPVLLTRRDAVPPATAAELTRLRPARIVVLGGPSVISEATQIELWSFQR